MKLGVLVMRSSLGAWFSKRSFRFQLHVETLSGFQSNLQINCCSSLQTNLPIFKLKESCVRRRYSDFEWLKNELERDSKVRSSSDLPVPASGSHRSSCSDNLAQKRGCGGAASGLDLWPCGGGR